MDGNLIRKDNIIIERKYFTVSVILLSSHGILYVNVKIYVTLLLEMHILRYIYIIYLYEIIILYTLYDDIYSQQAYY